jgi:hypothetical protein
MHWRENMKFHEKVRKFFEKRAKYWHVIVAIFLLLGVADNAFLNVVAPKWVCTGIMMLLIVVATCYVAIMYGFVRNKCGIYMNNRKEMLFSRIENLENNINELNEKNIELENKLAEVIQTNMNENTSKIISKLTETVEQTSQQVENGMQNFADNLDTRINKNVEDILTSVSNGFEEQKTIANNNTESIAKNMEEISNRIIEKVQKCNDQHEKLFLEQQNIIHNSVTIVENRIKEVSLAGAGLANGISENLAVLKNAVDSGTDSLNKKLSEQMKKVIVKLDEKAKRDDGNNEEHVKLINALSEKIAAVGKVSKNTTVSENIKILTIMKEHHEEQERLLKEHKNGIVSAIIHIQEKIKESSEIESDLVAGLSDNVSAIREKVNADTDKLSGEIIEHVSQIINKLEEKSTSDEETNSRQEGLIKEQGEQIDAIKLLVDEKTDEISTKTSEVQNEIVKLLNQVLDDTDKKSDKINSAYDRIFTQVVDFSRNTEQDIKKLQQTIDKYSKVGEKRQSDISGKLYNLQNQIVNFNNFTEILKNISVAHTQEISKTDPNLTEEIKDVETGTTVYNHYKNYKLVSSEMLTGKKKNYDINYDDKGRIVRSRNYGNNGGIVTELEFYPNGQVKMRTEKVMVNGKAKTVVSRFDEHGNKLR